MPRFFNNDIFSEQGSSVKVLYSPVVQDDGTIELVESGKEDLDSYIQSFRNECDIEYLISRFVNGDVSALNKRQGVYGDFTQLPKTFAEVLQLQIDSQKAFDGLPVEVKEKFDNDINKFIVSIGSDEWNKIMSRFSNVSVVTSTDTNNESEVTDK